MNTFRKFAILAGLGLAAATVAYVPSAEAASYVSVGVRFGPPPPPRWEPVPRVRYGYVWVPGYWNWAGARYVWVGGRWHPRRAGYVYVTPRWEHYGHGWRLHRGYWRRHAGHAQPRPVYRHGYREGYRHGYRRGERHERRDVRHAYRSGYRHGERHERHRDHRR